MIASTRIPAPTEGGTITQAERTDEQIKRTQLKVDIARNTLGIIAGVGGIAALLLAIRRQYQKELIDAANQNNLDRAHGHQVRIAADARFDAAERRITDLQIKAADQLGNERAAVRLAGLYALERLAQDNSQHRQVVVSIICAYLRMPYETPAEARNEGPEAIKGASEELVVRTTAQRILTDHSRKHRQLSDGTKVADEKFWPEIVMDLSGATLFDFDVRDCTLTSPDFTSSRFHGDASFFRAHLNGKASFNYAVFSGDLVFNAVNFEGLPLFGKSDFRGAADFGGCYVTNYNAGERVAEPAGWKLIKDPEGTPRLLMVRRNHSTPGALNIPKPIDRDST
ncbi:hypothetical protein Areg01_51550 [Actinoplanes regularis]|nr:hypothetical protein Areg01_51550 [Actinoplanes regularis]